MDLNTSNDIKINFNVHIPMRDGISLSTDIYYPFSFDKLTCVLIRTPYDKSQQWCIQFGRKLAIQGLVVCIQDIRGKYDSEGVFTFFSFDDDSKDVLDTMKWLSEKDWSNKHFAIIGISYSTLEIILLTNSSILKDIILIASFSNIFDIINQNGALLLHWALPWSIMMNGSINQRINNLFWPKLYKTLPLIDATRKNGLFSRIWKDWVSNKDETYWNSYNLRKLMADKNYL